MDLNADGNFDILSGSYSVIGTDAMAGLFQVLWGKPDGTFKKAETLNGTDGKPLIIPTKGEDDIIQAICTRPTAVDWDADGDLDLVVGNFAGAFYLFTGEGAGKFAPKPQQIMAGKEPLKIKGAHGDPFLVDWDGDGDLDLLSGSSLGGVQLAENTAGPKKAPTFTAFTTLIAPPASEHGEFRPDEVTAPSSSSRVWAADVNADGKLDLLLGDCVTLVSPAKGVSEEDFKKRRAEWNEAYAALVKQTEGVTDEAKLQPIWDQMNAMYEKKREFMNEDRTGFVWLYVQRASAPNKPAKDAAGNGR